MKIILLPLSHFYVSIWRLFFAQLNYIICNGAGYTILRPIISAPPPLFNFSKNEKLEEVSFMHIFIYFRFQYLGNQSGGGGCR